MSCISCSLGTWPPFSLIRIIDRNRMFSSPRTVTGAVATSWSIDEGPGRHQREFESPTRTMGRRQKQHEKEWWALAAFRPRNTGSGYCPDYQWVSEPSRRRCDAPGALSVIASMKVSIFSSTLTPRPGRSLGHTLPFLQSRNSGM
jgi:hypothetical protein